MDTITLPQTLITFQDLSTMGGLVVAVYVIVSFFKDMLKNWGKRYSGDGTGDWAVRPFSVLVALLITIWVLLVDGNFSVKSIGLAVINSFLVALVAGAAHDYIVAPTKGKISSSNQQPANNPAKSQTREDPSPAGRQTGTQPSEEQSFTNKSPFGQKNTDSTY